MGWGDCLTNTWQGTTETAATHYWITYALKDKDGSPNMAEQEQICFAKGEEQTPDGWVEVLRQPGKRLAGIRLNAWSDTARDAKETKRLADIEKQKPKGEVEP